jgi:hypothetical protein
VRAPRLLALLAAPTLVAGGCSGRLSEVLGGPTPTALRAPSPPPEDRTGRAGVVLVTNSVGWQRALGTPPAPGAVVAFVLPGSPAERAGIARGDVLTAVGEIEVRNEERAGVALRVRPGTRLPVTVARRDGTARLELAPEASRSVDLAALYDERLRATPGDPTLLLLRAQASDDPAAALGLLDRALEAQPDLVDALAYRARLRWLEALRVADEDPARAEEGLRAARTDFDRALAVDPNATRVLRLRAASLLEVNDLDGAERDALRALAVDPTLPSAHRILAAARLGAGRVREAAPEAAEAVRLGPYDAESYRVLAVVFLGLGRRLDAVATVEAGLRVATTDAERDALRAVLGEQRAVPS